MPLASRIGTLGLKAAHHILLSHGLAVPVLRQNSPDSEVGITLNFQWYAPATASAADAEAVRWMDGNFNRWFVEPVFGHHYPADMVADYTEHGMLPNGLDFVQEGDMAAIAAPLDFLGVNYYTREVVKMGEQGPTSAPEAGKLPRTEMDWEIYPQGLYNFLCRFHFNYGVPKLYVTENGCSYSDGPGLDDRVHDERRIRYLRDHFLAAHRALLAGVPLAGYFVWSLMDNFEWARGYTQRFGMVWVDYNNQQRILKDSALWYKEVIAANGVPE